MLSTIATLFGIANDSLKELERKPIKFITCLMIFLSIILIKPVIYYSTLYEKFCRLSLFIVVSLIVFFICYVIWHKKNNEYYDSDTLQVLLGIYILLVVSFLFGYFKQKYFFENYFANEIFTETEYIAILHNKPYFEELYTYAFSYFFIIMIYCFEFVQMVSFAYLILFTLKKLLYSENPLKYGMFQSDFNVMFINCFIIIVTSPALYEIYSDFWSKIF